MELKTACHGRKVAAIAEVWNDRVYTLKRGLSSTKKVFGVYCEGQRRRGCRAHYMVHMPSDVGPE